MSKRIDLPAWEANENARIKQALAPFEALANLLAELPLVEGRHDHLNSAAEIIHALHERARLMLLEADIRLKSAPGGEAAHG